MADLVRVVTVVELLQQSESTIVDEHGNERSTAEVLAAGQQLAADLTAAGVEPGDRVAVQMHTHQLYVDLLAAAAIGGFIITSVNPRFGEMLATSIIDRSGSKLVIRNDNDLPPPVSACPDFAAAEPTNRYVIFTTSGTTSAPKLVVHQQRSIAVHGGDVAQAMGYGPNSVALIAVPLCGVFGFTSLWAALAAHAKIILPTTFDAEQAGQLIEQHRVTSMHGSDDMFHRLLATDHDLSSIETAGYARFNSALDGIVERCEQRGVHLSGLYGMSECQALYAYRGGQELSLEDRWRPAGPLVSDRADCRVVDDELQLQGPSMFEGYLADGGNEIDVELTAAAFDGPWFRTGDLAKIDGPRSFEYITRIGDVLRLGGFLVAPTEIEGALMQLPEIDQAQVVAVGLEKGARPVAFVILAPGASLDEAAVIDHCASLLARFKCPVRIVAVNAYPVTDGPNGVKIQRAKLRAMATEVLAT